MAFLSESLILGLLGISIALFAIIYTYFKWLFQYWQRRNVFVPLKPKFPSGNLFSPTNKEKGIFSVVLESYRELKKKNEKYGGIYFLTDPYLIVVDPEILRLIMTKDSQLFEDRGVYYNEEKNPLAGHLFNISGPKWKYLRGKLTPTFTSGKMKMMFNTLLECGEPLINSIEEYARNQSPLNIKEVLANFTIDVIGSCAFGLDCSSFAGQETDFKKHGKKFFAPSVKALFIDIFGAVFPRLARKFGLEMLESDTLEFFINIVKNNIDFREKNNFRRNDFFQLLMDIKRKSEEDTEETPLTVEVFAAQVFIFFVAGYESSSITMTFGLYELAKNQDIQKHVRDEVNSVLRRHDGKFTYDALQDMKLLRCVVDETVRMYPAGPNVTRVSSQDYKLPDSDLTIEKGVRCIVPIFSLHHDEDYFPEPEVFKPDRFSEENKDSIKPFTYIPFGEGPRSCIGLRFGIMQSMVGLALLLQHFEFLPNSKTIEPITFFPHSLALSTNNKIWLTTRKVNAVTRTSA